MFGVCLDCSVRVMSGKAVRVSVVSGEMEPVAGSSAADVTLRLEWPLPRSLNRVLDECKPKQRMTSPVFTLSSVAALPPFRTSSPILLPTTTWRILLFPKGVKADDISASPPSQHLSAPLLGLEITSVDGQPLSDNGSLVEVVGNVRISVRASIDEEQPITDYELLPCCGNHSFADGPICGATAPFTFGELCLRASRVEALGAVQLVLYVTFLRSSTSITAAQGNNLSSAFAFLTSAIVAKGKQVISDAGKRLETLVENSSNTLSANATATSADSGTPSQLQRPAEADAEQASEAEWGPLFRLTVACPHPSPWKDKEAKWPGLWTCLVTAILERPLLLLWHPSAEAAVLKELEGDVEEGALPPFLLADVLSEPPAKLIIDSFRAFPQTLEKCRFDLVPKYLSEKSFWKRFLLLVALAASSSRVAILRRTVLTLLTSAHSDLLDRWLSDNSGSIEDAVNGLFQRLSASVSTTAAFLNFSVDELSSQIALAKRTLEQLGSSGARGGEAMRTTQSDVEAMLNRWSQEKVLLVKSGRGSSDAVSLCNKACAALTEATAALKQLSLQRDV